MNEAAMPISTMCVPAALKNEVVPTEGFCSEIEQIQQYLSSHYAFMHNKVTNRVLAKKQSRSQYGLSLFGRLRVQLYSSGD